MVGVSNLYTSAYLVIAVVATLSTVGALILNATSKTFSIEVPDDGSTPLIAVAVSAAVFGWIGFALLLTTDLPDNAFFSITITSALLTINGVERVVEFAHRRATVGAAAESAR